jgi:hypothetical protein
MSRDNRLLDRARFLKRFNCFCEFPAATRLSPLNIKLFAGRQDTQRWFCPPRQVVGGGQWFFAGVTMPRRNCRSKQCLTRGEQSPTSFVRAFVILAQDFFIHREPRWPFSVPLDNS